MSIILLLSRNEAHPVTDAQPLPSISEMLVRIAMNNVARFVSLLVQRGSISMD